MRIYTAARPGWIGAEFFHSAPATSWVAASVSRLPLLALILLGAWKRRPALARIALVWYLSYLALGQWQRQLAVALGEELAAQRGHIPVRLEVKPSFGNILVWKVVYETATDFHVDAVRAWPSAVVYEGNSIARLDLDRDLPWLARDSPQARDVERFAWFSNGYIARDPRHPGRLIDVRFSMLPNEIDSLWSIQLRPDARADEHVVYAMHRNTGNAQMQALWRMLWGE